MSNWLRTAHDSRARLLLLVAVAAVLATGASVGIAWVAGFHEVWNSLIYPHWIWFPIAFGAQVVAYVGYTFAYREIARAERGPDLELTKAAALVAAGFGVFVAAGGFALDAQALQRAGLTKSEARARVLGLGVLEYVVLAPATAIAALFVVIRRQDIGFDLTLPWIVCVPLGFAAAFVLLRFRGRFEHRRGWRARVAHTLAAMDLVKCLVTKPRSYAGAFPGIALYWLGDIACLWAALHAFYAHTPPVAQLVLGYATGYALTRRTLPLGGAGIVEALLPIALGWVAIGLAPALLAVIAYRLLNLWLPLVPALAGLPTLRRLRRTTPAAARS
jgi:uncharacterized membrane protein YbhN (UPF0104 family)